MKHGIRSARYRLRMQAAEHHIHDAHGMQMADGMDVMSRGPGDSHQAIRYAGLSALRYQHQWTRKLHCSSVVYVYAGAVAVAATVTCKRRPL